jgi:uncharacterized protein
MLTPTAMIGILSDKQIEHVLQAEIVGRLGCFAEGKVYIVPINYVYHESCIYAHAKEGLKIHMMRQNPHVCFQVEQVDNLANWRSVLVWGEFEELHYPGLGSEGMKLLQERLYPYQTSETVFGTHAHPLPELPHPIEKERRPVAFRITISERSGRFEKMG